MFTLLFSFLEAHKKKVSIHVNTSVLCFSTVCLCGFRAEDEEKDKVKKEAMAKQKIRQNYISKCDEPDLQESAFWKKIIAYQRKLLVGHFCIYYVFILFIHYLHWMLIPGKLFNYSSLQTPTLVTIEQYAQDCHTLLYGIAQLDIKRQTVWK